MKAFFSPKAEIPETILTVMRLTDEHELIAAPPDFA